jgi:glycosyltransferase involved in cell wall biosynthesis
VVNGSARFHLLEVGLAMPPETFLRRKFEGLARRGVRVTISATRSDQVEGTSLQRVEVVPAPRPDESVLRVLGALVIGVLRVGLRRPSVLRATIRAARNPIRDESGRRLLTFALRLRSYLPLALIEPDVVQFEWNSAAIHYLPMADVWSCPTVVSCHGSDTNVRPHAPDGRDYARWLHLSFDRVTATHCVSNAIANQAAELGMNTGRAWLIRPAVDPELFRPAMRERASTRQAASPRPLRVVSVGDFRWLKAHEYSVRTLALLTSRGVPVELEIIGGDPAQAVAEDSDRDRVEHAIARNGLGDRVKLTGALSSEAVCERLQAADALLHSSLTEGLPNAVLEAMACGLPVVAGDCGGVAEAVRDGVEGFVVPVRGVSEAADALCVLHEDEALRLKMGRAGRERVKLHFSLQAQLDDFLTMYRSLCNGVTRSSLPPAAAGEPQLRLLSVGPLYWTQGFDDAMQAVSIVRKHGVDCRQRIFGEGPHLNALWFARYQLGLERYVELRGGEELSHVSTKAWLHAGRGASQLHSCSQWRRQLEWADALLDTSLRDPPLAALAAARAAGVEVISIGVEPQAIAEALIAIAAARGSQPRGRARAAVPAR